MDGFVHFDEKRIIKNKHMDHINEQLCLIFFGLTEWKFKIARRTNLCNKYIF